MKYLVDSDWLVCLFHALEENHPLVVKKTMQLHRDKHALYCLNLVKFESATVISYRLGHKMAKNFINNFSSLNLNMLSISSKVEQLSWIIFLQQNKKGTSFIDCANVASIKYYNLDGICSLDHFYHHQVTTY